jgi:predicted nucleic acid-binding Zn ribbon protein
VYRLDERDGVLYFRGHRIVALADLRPWFGDSRTNFYWEDNAAAKADLFAAAGVIDPRIANDQTHVCRCRICDGWTTGGGSFCSKECGRVDRAREKAELSRKARERRAKARVIVNEVCLVCGGPLAVLRTTRRFCSSRCRQAEHRKRHRQPPPPRNARHKSPRAVSRLP